MSENKTTRLNKFISETGYCSRREADKLIEQGRVTINGHIPEMGTKVQDGDQVQIDDKPIKQKQRPIYIALNKPTGITCTTERDIPGNIVDFIGHHQRIFPIGRLDKPSDGLIFLTNDGDIVNKILRAGNNHEKEYVVRVDKPITDHFVKKMASGVPILDTVTLPCQVTKETEYSFRIVLTQGLNRQIRRMCEALGYEVFKLRRVRIMNISIDGIPNGKWRYLTDEEMQQILAMCEGSIGTEEASTINSKGQRIARATDAKLFDSREENQPSRARRNQKQRTYSGHRADDFRHAPNSKKGQQRSTRNSSENRNNSESNYSENSYTKSDYADRSNNRQNNSDQNSRWNNRSDDTKSRSNKKPYSNNANQQRSKPTKPVTGTLRLKK